ncbi:MAG: SAM-dependent methyltransferase [Odoribacter sp.]|nr:SAM-dependent methyltransferase [Odoribacter sp.]
MNFTDLKFKAVYWAVNKLDKYKEVHFMNFGYHDPEKSLSLVPADEKNRYSIQLYQHLTGMAELNNKDIVEIGSGRGGGLNYLARNNSASSLKGIDLSHSAIAFSNKHHKLRNLSFQYGDAQEIPLDNNSCDIVLNVESSHRYPKMDRFLSEVIRILKSGGYFLFTDFRYDYEWSELHGLFERSGLKIITETDITSFVSVALESDDRRRRTLVKKLAPKFLQGAMLNFAGTIGSETYDYFSSRKYVYKSYAFQKL